MNNHFLALLDRQLASQAESFPGMAGFSVRDLVSGEQLSLLGDEPFPSASTIKIFILVALLCHAEQNASLLQQRTTFFATLADSNAYGQGLSS